MFWRLDLLTIHADCEGALRDRGPSAVHILRLPMHPRGVWLAAPYVFRTSCIHWLTKMLHEQSEALQR